MDGGDVSMAAVAIATPLRQDSEQRGRWCEGRGVTHTLVAGLGLCAAIVLGFLQRPGLAEGTLAAGENTGGRRTRAIRTLSIHRGNKGMGGGVHRWSQRCQSQSEVW